MEISIELQFQVEVQFHQNPHNIDQGLNLVWRTIRDI